MLFKVFAAAKNIFYFFKNLQDDDDDNDDDSNESTNTKPFCSKPTFRYERTLSITLKVPTILCFFHFYDLMYNLAHKAVIRNFEEIFIILFTAKLLMILLQ